MGESIGSDYCSFFIFVVVCCGELLGGSGEGVIIEVNLDVVISVLSWFCVMVRFG